MSVGRLMWLRASVLALYMAPCHSIDELGVRTPTKENVDNLQKIGRRPK
jgi:hypothetical protein